MRTRYENDFNAIAPVYDILSILVFGNTLMKSQKALIPLIPENASILFIGGGTGKILPDILQRNPQSICYVEQSGKMLQHAKQRVSGSKALIHWIEGNETHPAVKEGRFDVVITFFLLDLFNELSLQRLITTLYSSLTPNGLWLVADFNPTANQWVAQLLRKAMYAFFSRISRVQAHKLGPYPKLMEELPLRLIHRKMFYSNIIQSIAYRNASKP